MATYKHTHYDLAQMQSLPLEAKIEMSKRRIREWYDHYDGQVYVSFSGGKDSTVLKHLVDSEYSDVPAVFINTGLEYPEIQRFVKDVKAGRWDCFNTDVVILRPEKRFDQVIRDEGYPVISKQTAELIRYAQQGRPWAVNAMNGLEPDGSVRENSYKAQYKKYAYIVDAPFKVSERCCLYMKKKPAHNYEHETQRKPILGMLAAESQQRKHAWMATGCNAFDAARPESSPMAFWTEQDVLQYLVDYSVPYAKDVYGEIAPAKTTGGHYARQVYIVPAACSACSERT